MNASSFKADIAFCQPDWAPWVYWYWDKDATLRDEHGEEVPCSKAVLDMLAVDGWVAHTEIKQPYSTHFISPDQVKQTLRMFGLLGVSFAYTCSDEFLVNRRRAAFQLDCPEVVLDRAVFVRARLASCFMGHFPVLIIENSEHIGLKILRELLDIPAARDGLSPCVIWVS